ncbi:hypothetical protein TRE132_36890 [Pseudomonas chlororaphis subsp. aurantiaca]|uniref:acyl carrier protein n=1 Tax=Pseudomonas chlororaphis TaxID=587753 RepID=UPI000864B67B|nr:acyl carrier protein [Pseudomonas chlororaphis]BAV75628.1 JamE [Pseudomonas chlororaphis subsp. aurantiaca]BBN55564.1 hypothetical protein TRE132_36890 [Pseudomonas chlororaphis subsp. aurantiaca]
MNAHALDPMAYVPALSPITRQTVSNWISSWLSERDYDEDPSTSSHTPFSEMGLSSIDAVELATELSHASKVPLDATIAWHYPTPAELAGYVADTATASTRPSAAPQGDEPAADTPSLQHLDEHAMAELLESLLTPRSSTPVTG